MQKAKTFEVTSNLCESTKSMIENELKRIVVSAKRHSLYQLLWVALFFPIGIVGLIISYIIYRKDIPMHECMQAETFYEMARSIRLIHTVRAHATRHKGRVGFFRNRE